MLKDYMPTKETISLHGLGFIQLKLPNALRMHVWHPELPRRKCFEHSSVHNHRFSFNSTVIKGTQINVRCDLEFDLDGAYDLISHNGPRTETGSRESKPVARCNVYECEKEIIIAGDHYSTPAHEYHRTEAEGIVITIMRKVSESEIHANSVCAHGINFDTSFDRFQFSEDELYEFVVDAFKH